MKFFFTLFLIIFVGSNYLFSQSRVWEVSDSIKIFKKNSYENISINCIDKNKCIVFSIYKSIGAVLRQTTDGGLNWNIIYVDTTILVYNEQGEPDTSSHFPYFYDNFKYFEDGTISFVIKKYNMPEDLDYYHITSKDFGKNWDTVEVFKDCYPWYRYFRDNSILLTKFYPNKLIYDLFMLDENSSEWIKVNIPNKFKPNLPFYYIKDKDNFFVYIKDEINNYYLLRFYDNYSKIEETKITDLEFINMNYIDDVLYGLNSSIDDNIQKDKIYKSFDYGKTWQIILDTNARKLKNIKFISKDVGIAYGHTNYNVLRTIDGGINWLNDYFSGRDINKPFKDIEISDVEIIDKDNMFLLVKREPIYKLTDKIAGSFSDSFENLDVSVDFYKDYISITNKTNEPNHFVFSIYDIMGNEAVNKYTYLTSNANYDIELDNLINGIYIIKIKSNSQVYYNKFIKWE